MTKTIKMYPETLTLSKQLVIANDLPFGEGHLEVQIMYKHGSFGLQLTDGYSCLALRFAENYSDIKKHVSELLALELA